MLDLIERKAIFRASTLKRRLADPQASRLSIADAMRGVPGFLPYLQSSLPQGSRGRGAEELLVRHGMSTVERHLNRFVRRLRERREAH